MCWRPQKKVIITVVFVGFLFLLLFTFKSPLITPDSAHGGNSIGVKAHEAQRFPQAIIIGVKKGGTRALISMLNLHPQIESANGEIHFFDRNETFRKGVKWYVQQMPFSTQSQITVEKSPSYFVMPHVPPRIHKMSPTIKLLLIVRDPIERVISDYIQLFNPQRIGMNKSFDDVVLDAHKHVNERAQVIRVSCYDIHMVHWLKYFTRQQIHIVNGDALIHNPAQELIKVQEFLGISNFFRKDMFYFNATKGFFCWHKTKLKGNISPNCLGSSKGHSHPTIPKYTRECLKRYFFTHNEHFFQLVGINFDWNT